MDKETDKKDKLSQEIKGMAFGAVGIFLLIALLSFRTDDFSFNSYSSESGVRNLSGRR